MDELRNDSSQIKEVQIEIKKELSQATLDTAKYITERVPQFDTDHVTEESQINYYFAGSFAANLFSQITSFRDAQITVLHQEGGGQKQLTISPEERTLTDEARSTFQDFIRKLGDIDVDLANDNLYNQMGRIKIFDIIEHVPSSRKLFKEPNINGLLDFLGEGHSDQRTNNIIIAKINNGNDNVEILLAHPSDMIAYKLIELLLMDRSEIPDNEGSIKYTHKIQNDIAILHEGISKIYGNTDSLLPAFKEVASNMGYEPEGAARIMGKKLSSILESKNNPNSQQSTV